MERVLDVYKRPYNADFPVVCMDESPKQLIEEGRPSTAMKPGQEAREDYEYVRHGVAKYLWPMNLYKENVLWKLQNLRPKEIGHCLSR